MDGLWIFLSIVVVAGILKDNSKSRMRHRERMAQADSGNADAEERFRKIEQRLANIETIVIERDKKHEFEQALK